MKTFSFFLLLSKLLCRKFKSHRDPNIFVSDFPKNKNSLGLISSLLNQLNIETNLPISRENPLSTLYIFLSPFSIASNYTSAEVKSQHFPRPYVCYLHHHLLHIEKKSLLSPADFRASYKLKNVYNLMSNRNEKIESSSNFSSINCRLKGFL